MRGWVTIYLMFKLFRVRFSITALQVTIKISKKIWCLRHYISKFGSQQELWDFGENSGAGSLQTRLWYVIVDRRSCKSVIHHIYGHVTNVRFNQNSAMAASNLFPSFHPCCSKVYIFSQLSICFESSFLSWTDFKSSYLFLLKF